MTIIKPGLFPTKDDTIKGLRAECRVCKCEISFDAVDEGVTFFHGDGSGWFTVKCPTPLCGEPLYADMPKPVKEEAK